MLVFMNTEDTVETKVLTEHDIKEGSLLLKQGELLGIPTETVYGLGANGLDPEAVSKIFLVKGRPQDNPLILHIGAADWMSRYCDNIPEEAWVLANKFWPGPLTLILDAKDSVPEVVRGGLNTVGLRCPNHPLALALIQEADIPIAAPSGNLSGKPSPTTASAMLEDMDGKIFAVFEGGNCDIGVESTIISLGNEVRLLRAGGISVEELEETLGKPILSKKLEEGEAPLAPGMKYRHYAPQAPVTVVMGENSSQWIAEQSNVGDGVICFQEYQDDFDGRIVQTIGKEKDFTEQGRQVFSALRFFDSTRVNRIWAQCPADIGIGTAVANRLQKAAGFQIIQLEGDESE